MLKVTLSRLDKKRAKLKRNKQNDKLKLLMDESGLVNSTEDRRDSSCTVMNLAVADLSTFELETLYRVNVDLAGELKRSEDALNDQKLKMDELCAKLSKLGIRNVSKKLKRRDNKIKKSMLHGQLKKESEDKSATIAQLENRLVSAQQGKECYRSKVNQYVKVASVSETAYDEIQYQLVGLKEEYQFKLDGLENEVAEFHREIQTFLLQKYATINS